MLYGVKELWFKKNGVLIPLNKGLVLTEQGNRRAKAMYINVPLINSLFRFNVRIGGAHPNPTPHIRLGIKNQYFEYQQTYGAYEQEWKSGTSATSIRSSSRGTHNVEIEVTNLPVPSTISLSQNTISSPSRENYLDTYIDNVLADSQFWANDQLIAVSMEEENYPSTPVLQLNVGYYPGHVLFERLLPIG